MTQQFPVGVLVLGLLARRRDAQAPCLTQNLGAAARESKMQKGGGFQPDPDPDQLSAVQPQRRPAACPKKVSDRFGHLCIVLKREQNSDLPPDSW